MILINITTIDNRQSRQWNDNNNASKHDLITADFAVRRWQ